MLLFQVFIVTMHAIVYNDDNVEGEVALCSFHLMIMQKYTAGVVIQYVV